LEEKSWQRKKNGSVGNSIDPAVIFACRDVIVLKRQVSGSASGKRTRVLAVVVYGFRDEI